MSFIVVKYGKDQEKLFNTNCKVINLLHCIRETCGFKDSEIDLAEESTGVLQFLPSNLHEHTSSLLAVPKTTYVLIRIQKGEDGTMEYVPMVEMTRSNFLVKLKSTRTKPDTMRKRGPDKKTKEEGEIPTLAVPTGGSLSASTGSTSSSSATSPTTPVNATTPPSAPVSTTAAVSAPATAAGTPTKGKPAGAKSPKKSSLFPKIDGADASPAQASSAQVGSEDSTLVTTSPILPPSTRKRTPKKSGSLLEPIVT